MEINADKILDRYISDSSSAVLTAAVGIGSLSTIPSLEQQAINSAILYGTPKIDAHAVATLTYKSNKRTQLQRELADVAVLSISTARVGVDCQRQKAEQAINRIQDLVLKTAGGSNIDNIYDRQSLLLKCIIRGKGIDNEVLVHDSFHIESEDNQDTGDIKESAQELTNLLKSITGESSTDFEKLISNIDKTFATFCREWGDELRKDEKKSNDITVTKARKIKLQEATATLRTILGRNAFLGPCQFMSVEQIELVKRSLENCGSLLATNQIERMLHLILFAVNFKEEEINKIHNTKILIKKRAAFGFHHVAAYFNEDEKIKLKRRTKKETLTGLAFIFKSLKPGMIYTFFSQLTYSNDKERFRIAEQLAYCNEFHAAWNRYKNILNARKETLEHTDHLKLRIDQTEATAALSGPLDAAVSCAADALEYLNHKLEKVIADISLGCQLWVG